MWISEWITSVYIVSYPTFIHILYGLDESLFPVTVEYKYFYHQLLTLFYRSFTYIKRLLLKLVRLFYPVSTAPITITTTRYYFYNIKRNEGIA